MRAQVSLSPASCVEREEGAAAAAATATGGVRVEDGVGVAAALTRGLTTAGEPGPRSIRLSSSEASFSTYTST